MKLAIVGKGFVGNAVYCGFDTSTTQITVVDPVHSSTSLAQAVLDNPELLFVCVPTPESITGAVDTSVVSTVLAEISAADYPGVVVIKSTITPNFLTEFAADYQNLRIVYNPEFLTAANAVNDFINPAMQILGGKRSDTVVVEQAYLDHSLVKVVPTFKTDIVTASLIKYTINCWLATKVSFMNELHQLHSQSGADSTWAQFTDMLTRDSRIGTSHVNVPGPDGEFGFGGHCFPKDTQGLLHYADLMNVDLSVLQQAVSKNNKIRKSKLV
jgi:nucleotide sugar dehydrogenase